MLRFTGSADLVFEAKWLQIALLLRDDRFEGL